MNSGPVTATGEWIRDRPASIGGGALALTPVLVALAVFKLAISGGGWDLESLALVQTVVFVMMAAVVWAGRARRVAVARTLTGLAAAIALTTLWSVRPDASVRELLLWMMYLGIFVVMASTLTGPAAAWRVLDAAVAIGGWLCLVGLSRFWSSNDLGLRWSSTFYWPNPFAAFLLLVLPISLTRFLHARTVRVSVAHGVITLVLAVAFVLTYSRGAWLSLAAITPLAIIVLRAPSSAAAVRRVAMISALVAVSVALLTKGAGSRSFTERVLGRSVSISDTGVLGRFTSIADAGDYSLQGRLSFWRSGLAVFRDHPLVGTGPRTYGVVHTRYQDDVRFYAIDAHNLYIETAAEMGLVGATALAVLLTSIAALWIRTLRAARGTGEYPLVVGVGLGLAAFFLHSAMDVNWLFPANPAMAFVLVGVLAWYDQSVSAPFRAGSWPIRGGWRLAVGVAMLAAVTVVQLSRVAQQQFVEGQQLMHTGQWSAAAARFARATRWNPLSSTYFSAQAAAATRVPNPRVDIVVSSIQHAMALDRMNASHPVQLATLLLAQGVDDPRRAAEAEALLRQALILDRFNDPDVYRVLAQLYLHQGRIEDAERVYRDARGLYIGHGLGRGAIIYLDLWQKAVNLFMDSADLAARRGDLAQATQLLREALTEDPGAVQVAMRLSAIYVQMGRPDEARAVLEATAARVPDNAAIQTALKALR